MARECGRVFPQGGARKGPGRAGRGLLLHDSGGVSGLRDGQHATAREGPGLSTGAMIKRRSGRGCRCSQEVAIGIGAGETSLGSIPRDQKWATAMAGWRMAAAMQDPGLKKEGTGNVVETALGRPQMERRQMKRMATRVGKK